MHGKRSVSDEVLTFLLDPAALESNLRKFLHIKEIGCPQVCISTFNAGIYARGFDGGFDGGLRHILIVINDRYRELVEFAAHI